KLPSCPTRRSSDLNYRCRASCQAYFFCDTSPDVPLSHDPAFSTRLFFLYSIDTSGCTVPHTCLHSDTAPYKAISARPDASPCVPEILYHFSLLFPMFLSPFMFYTS